MRRLTSSILASAVLLISSSSSKAEELSYNFWGLTTQEIPDLPTFTVTPLLDGFERDGAYLYNSDTGSILQISDQSPITNAPSEYWTVDPATKKLYIPSNPSGGGRAGSYFHVLDPVTKTWSKECEGDDTFDWARLCDVRIPDGGITYNGSTGITSLGPNSLKLQETSTQQKMWGTNASGESVPINITNGSKLLIGGVEVIAGAGGNSEQVTTNTSNISSNDTDIANLQSLFRTKSGSTTTTKIGTSTQNVLEIGGDTNPTTIDQEGISVGGSNLIKKTSTGDIHIGKNSFVIGDDVVNGAHPIWAEDETGSKIPINIHGSKLLIDGVEVTAGDSEQVTTNKNNITTNTSNISSNDTDISTNASNISSNDTDISTNASNISSNDTDISTNASNISSNDTDIATNASNISSNDTDIATNASNISSNDTDIATNASNISSNDTDIAANASNISSNKNNINNLGQGIANATALTAALTALPQASTDSKFSCGVGTGTYSNSYALGVGCASKVNERVDVNFGGSYVRGGSKDYGSGSLENVAAKAGFIFKLGKITKPTLISMKEKKVLQSKVDKLESIIALQNQRLEQLEQIALGNFNSKELVSSLQ